LNCPPNLPANLTPSELADKIAAESSLYEFLRQSWDIIEPGTAFVGGWHIEIICLHLEAVFDGRISNILINVPPGTSKSTCCAVALPAWAWIHKPEWRILSASYSGDLSMRDAKRTRDIIESPWYQRFWGDRFEIAGDQNAKSHYSNEHKGWRIATSIGAKGTGLHPDCAIVDDAQNAKKAMSEADRLSVIDWWRGTISSRGRTRDMRRIVIGQRLNEEDLSGYILSTAGDEWDLMVLPMRAEPGAMKRPTRLGWIDRRPAGELLWPAAMPEGVVALMERELGPYKCTPYEAPVLMADLSMKPIGEVKTGDTVIGFSRKQRKDGRPGRLKLAKAAVTEVQSFVAPVVRMTLDSGEVVRCTPDHRWFTRSRGPERDCYLPATAGRTRLARVCPPRLPELSPEDARLAGWLSGFFDGEGSVSLCAKDSQEYRNSASICFYQGAGRNLPLCEKLEHALKHFGFGFTVREDERKENKTAACYGYRQYRLTEHGLPLYQRFLHIVQPTKWRDRIESGALSAMFIQGRERVLTIEPDGVETVYALTTETGNYVVWGLASSNSAGQLQQRPSPEGGGMFKRDWYELLDTTLKLPATYPRVRYWDCAHSETAESDFTAGVKMAVTPDGRFVIENIVHGKFEPGRRDAIIKQTAYLDGPTVPIVIEIEGGAGKSILHHYIRLLPGFAVSGQKHIVDKVARGHSFAGYSQVGQVQIIAGPNVETLLDELTVFPNGKHDDLVDAACAAFNWLAERHYHQGRMTRELICSGGDEDRTPLSKKELAGDETPAFLKELLSAYRDD
jgi:predicted phage terminase large subunit-like protein